MFPEYSSYFVDPFDSSLAENAEDLDGPFVQALAALASELDVVVVAGLVERAGRRSSRAQRCRGGGCRWPSGPCIGSSTFTTPSVSVSPTGVEPGEIAPPQTFEVDGLRFGLMTCYDLRFPEVARTLADAAADVALVPAEWVRGPLKEHHWKTLLTARAIENTFYVAAADSPAAPRRRALDDRRPQGVTLAQVGTATDVAVAHVDPAAIARVRRVNPALELRRYRVTPR